MIGRLTTPGWRSTTQRTLPNGGIALAFSSVEPEPLRPYTETPTYKITSQIQYSFFVCLLVLLLFCHVQHEARYLLFAADTWHDYHTKWPTKMDAG